MKRDSNYSQFFDSTISTKYLMIQ